MKKSLSGGAGLGFRKELIPALKAADHIGVDFFELAPENWIAAGGRHARDLRQFTERYPFTCHGLSLSIGSTDPLDVNLLKRIKAFLQAHDIELYTEHLSWCSQNGHLYDLLPIPCTEEAVKWVSARIRQVQDILEMPIGLENASYYFSPPGSEMDEQAFIQAVLKEADCLLHLDVNNIYVNSKNFGFDPVAYLQDLPLDRTCYIHVAGHFTEADGLIIDTHGADVIDPVWELLGRAYELIGAGIKDIPTCLERDFNFPDIGVLIQEVEKIRAIQARCTGEHIKRLA